MPNDHLLRAQQMSQQYTMQGIANSARENPYVAGADAFLAGRQEQRSALAHQLAMQQGAEEHMLNIRLGQEKLAGLEIQRALLEQQRADYNSELETMMRRLQVRAQEQNVESMRLANRMAQKEMADRTEDRESSFETTPFTKDPRSGKYVYGDREATPAQTARLRRAEAEYNLKQKISEAELKRLDAALMAQKERAETEKAMRPGEVSKLEAETAYRKEATEEIKRGKGAKPLNQTQRRNITSGFSAKGVFDAASRADPGLGEKWDRIGTTLNLGRLTGDDKNEATKAMVDGMIELLVLDPRGPWANRDVRNATQEDKVGLLREAIRLILADPEGTVGMVQAMGLLPWDVPNPGEQVPSGVR